MASKETCWNIVNCFNQHAQQEAPAFAFSTATVRCHMRGGDNNKEPCAQTHHCVANSLDFFPLWISAALGAVNMRAIYPPVYKVTGNQPKLRRWTTYLDKSNVVHVGELAVWYVYVVLNLAAFWEFGSLSWAARCRKILTALKWSTCWLR